MPSFPPLRLREANEAPNDLKGRYVLYWMISARRASWSFALDRAVTLCRELGKPLLVLEPLRAGYPWASDRLHAFVLQGMADNAAAFAAAGVTYLPYVEPRPGAGRGLLEALADRACAVVTDSFPASFLPRMVAAAAGRLRVRLEVVDGNGLLPIEAVPRAPLTAHAFRRALQRLLPAHLGAFPSARPLQAAGLRGARLPPGVARRWPRAPAALLRAEPAALARLPIDHAVPPAPRTGGTTAARAALRAFVRRGLARYADDRSHPDLDATSGLSPWLHFGHLSAHEVFRSVARAEGWTPASLGSRRDGGREGWWGMSPAAEAFLDQLVTWRELAFGFSAHRDDAGSYDGLPPWARATLERHAADPRPWRYGLAELEVAATHDPLWNAAQRQLRAEGRIHNQLRMLWGKKILEWSPGPRAAWEALVALNDRWALDGRDPCSYAGLGWCLGRFDRPWGPERPIFGTVRYMSSDAARRKLKLKAYLARHAG
ncbi:MAG: deoxyribodipyrimidine photolyase [Deltaproteobacteria bacterium]|nr:deoxyribodipyrimidine photolyase [Deltaproteobacteria bacterium]